ncbi:hypothetical protein F0562_008202 [Nyssa sinensis]|uniref:Uncharacterized protein n=1 Tax=Nyssa sinensis TaxID=561372 RepID=A0A5J5A673_9ASTE|nr:hypothetical protein F0562_008202 [Nyssa sinensis]
MVEVKMNQQLVVIRRDQKGGYGFGVLEYARGILDGKSFSEIIPDAGSTFGMCDARSMFRTDGMLNPGYYHVIATLPRSKQRVISSWFGDFAINKTKFVFDIESPTHCSCSGYIIFGSEEIGNQWG